MVETAAITLNQIDAKLSAITFPLEGGAVDVREFYLADLVSERVVWINFYAGARELVEGHKIQLIKGDNVLDTDVIRRDGIAAVKIRDDATTLDGCKLHIW